MKRIIAILIIAMLALGQAANAAYAQQKYNLEDVASELAAHYEGESALSFRTALSLGFSANRLGLDRDNINDGIAFKKGSNVAEIVANVLYNVAKGDAKGEAAKEWLSELSKCQKSDGSFYKAKGDEHLANTAWAVIALDVCGYEYDSEGAARYIVSTQKSSGEYYKNDDVDTTCMAIQALSKHMDVEGVEDSVEKAFDFISESQLEDGEFMFMGDKNPYTLCEVIQAIIATGKDVYSAKWEKDGRSPVDVLMGYEKNGKFRYTTKFGYEESMCTERAFMTICQLYAGKYMFESADNYEADEDNENHDDNGDEDESYDGLKLELVGGGEYSKNEEAFVKIQVGNGTGADVSAVLIVCVYDEYEERMNSYSYHYIDLENGKSARIDTGFYIPDSKDQVVKIMLVDSLGKMNVLAEPIETEVD